MSELKQYLELNYTNKQKVRQKMETEIIFILQGKDLCQKSEDPIGQGSAHLWRTRPQ